MKLIYLSNLIYSKGILHLLRAVVSLNENLHGQTQIELRVYGRLMSDQYMHSSKLAIELSEFSDKKYISINPPVGRSDVSRVLEEADVFVLPTFYESEAFPVSVLEAIRFNCKIILSHHNYLSDIFVNYNIIWASTESVSSLIIAIKAAINMSDKLVEENRYRVIEENSFSAFSVDVQLLLNRLLER